MVVDIIDKNFVLVTGPKDLTGVRRRRANIDHLEPTEQKIPLKRGADDETVMKLLKKTVEEAAPKKRKKPSRKKAKAEAPPAVEAPEEAKAG
nr:hypothetical protein [Candidatus Hecatella orcuttiae]